MGRRGENIHKRRDGRWEARVICRYSPEGKAVYRSIYGKTYQEAKDKRKVFMSNLSAVKNYELPQDMLKVTFDGLVCEWLEHKKGSVKESTYAAYVGIYKNHLRRSIGELYLPAVTADVIDSFLKEKMEHGRKDGNGGLSPKTVADIRSVISMVLEYAKSRNYPCRVENKLFYPAGITSSVTVLNRNEQKKLEETVFRSYGQTASGILLALYCGLRIGEICALQWKDIDFEEGVLHISKTLIRIRNLSPDASHKTKVIIEKPKTVTSTRIIPAPGFLLRYLKTFYKNPEDYILTGTSAFTEPRVYLNQYKKILKESGVRMYTFHALRHTFATRWVENGLDIKSLSEILGHSNVKTTLQRYVHPSMESKRNQMERLADNCICGQKSGHECA